MISRLSICILFLVGCAAPQSKETRTINEHQVEGRMIYRETETKTYFVQCHNGLKYLGVAEGGVAEIVGPLDVCKGEQDE